MGIYNRDYYREIAPKGGGTWSLDGLTPVIKWLIIINVAVFLLQIFVVREVHVSFLEEMRKTNPEIDRLLTAKEQGDPEAEKVLNKKYHLDKYLEQMDSYPATQRESII